MNTIKFNNTTFLVDSFNKNTYLVDGTIVHDGNCIIKNNNLQALHELMSETITEIYIYHDDILIYNSENLNVTISSVNEHLDEDHMTITLNLKFDN